MHPLDEFTGCTAISCVRQFKGPKKRANYLIEETCRYALNNSCSFKKVINEIPRAQTQTFEGVKASI